MLNLPLVQMRLGRMLFPPSGGGAYRPRRPTRTGPPSGYGACRNKGRPSRPWTTFRRPPSPRSRTSSRAASTSCRCGRTASWYASSGPWPKVFDSGTGCSPSSSWLAVEPGMNTFHEKIEKSIWQKISHVADQTFDLGTIQYHNGLE